MKALTLTQPWATLMAYGEKVVETRSWNTAHRGALAIHAAKGFPKEARTLCREEPFRSALIRIFGSNPMSVLVEQLPRGAVLAEVRLDDVLSTNMDVIDRALSSKELAFGDYSPDRFAWFTSNVRRLKTPFHVRGHLSLWDWEWQGGIELLEAR